MSHAWGSQAKIRHLQHTPVVGVDLIDQMVKLSDLVDCISTYLVGIAHNIITGLSFQHFIIYSHTLTLGILQSVF